MLSLGVLGFLSNSMSHTKRSMIIPYLHDYRGKSIVHGHEPHPGFKTSKKQRKSTAFHRVNMIHPFGHNYDKDTHCQTNYHTEGKFRGAIAKPNK